MNYKEHSEIAIPEWLIGWEDFSWHNDAMPHSILFLRGQEGPNVEAWINYPDPADREVPPRFELVYRVADDGLEMSGDETLYMGEDENEAREWAQAAVLARDIITGNKLKQAVPFGGNLHVYRILELWMKDPR